MESRNSGKNGKGVWEKSDKRTKKNGGKGRSEKLSWV